MQQQFTSIKNKAFLWDLMRNNNMFQTVPESKAGLVKDIFDKKIATIGLQITPTDQLVNLNKRVITEMVNVFAQEVVEAPLQIIYNSAELLQQRQSKFEMELKQKQSEFEKINSKPTPTKIDFTDKIEDKPLGAEMDKILAEQIAWRERELNLVLEKQVQTQPQPQPQTQQAPGPGPTPGPTPLPAPTQQAPTLKIGEPVPLDNGKKKVSFRADTEKERDSDNFFALLKKNTSTEPTTSELKAMLSEMLRKQDMILNLLQRN